MTCPPDAILTLLLLAPCLVVGVVAGFLLCPMPRKRHRRLTNAEVRRIYKITAERARQSQWN